MNIFWQKLKVTLRMIKFEHTLFALPFAFLGAVLAARDSTSNGLPTLWQTFWITLAMIGARSAAMAFNRIADRKIDAENPRTANREIPTGKLSVNFAWAFMLAACGLFVLAAGMLNQLTLILSPVALFSILFYSYAKRLTAFAHLILGWGLAIAPTGAWIAVRGALDSPVPILLSMLVMMWTAGFDVLYACQDFEFDRRAGLHSIPAKFGIAGALMIARIFHFQAFLVLIGLYLFTNLGWLALVGVVLTGTLLIYQHWLVKPNDLSRLNAAFFTTNAFVSIILFVTFGGAVLISKFQ
jgi:4-hydroxybenzoate polyprenyltransferase